MKFRIHLAVEILIFIITYATLGRNAALIITLFHFIPSLDLVKLHRQLFHNIFVVVVASALVFYLTGPLTGALATSNLILHIVMDLDKNGVAIFFPFSNHRLRIKHGPAGI